jgi:Family of unknown function (DUF6308)
MVIDVLELPSGLVVADPLPRLRRFCRAEYDYYDGVPQADPDRLDALDVLVTTAVNAFATASATRIRQVHQGLRTRVEPLLAEIPTDVDLALADQAILDDVRRLLDAAVQVPWVLVPVACKVLHRKRLRLIPMLDNVVLGYYHRTLDQSWLAAASQDKRRAAAAAMPVLVAFRDDLRAIAEPLGQVVDALAREGFTLTPVCALEVLLWTELEPYGQYRDQPPTKPAAAVGGDTPTTKVPDQLATWAAGFAQRHGIPEGALVIEPPLHPDEGAGLEQAVGAGLVSVDDDGTFRLTGAADAKGPYHLFSRGPRVTLNREYLSQIGAFAELVLRYCWPARRVVFEYDALDLVTLAPDGSVAVAGEVKRDQRLLDVMLGELTSMSRQDIQQGQTNAARKAAALVRLQPAVFWAVTPGARRAYDVTVRDGVPVLTPRDGLPNGPCDELDCPVCGSEDRVRGSGRPIDGRIQLSCADCGHRWSRIPRQPCPRCGSGEVTVSGYEGWAYEAGPTRIPNRHATILPPRSTPLTGRSIAAAVAARCGSSAAAKANTRDSDH